MGKQAYEKAKTKFLNKGFAALFTIILIATFFFLAHRVAIIYGKTFGFMFSFLIGIPLLSVFIIWLEQHKERNSKILRSLYNFLSVCLGFIFFGVWAAVIEQISVILFPKLFVYSNYLLPFYVLFFASIGLVSAQNIRVKRTKIPVQGIKENLRIAHISDLHMGAIRRPHFLSQAVKRINKEKPDLVVITGDIFDGSGNPAEWMVTPLKNIKAKTLAVLGNHDNYFDGNKAEQFLKKQGVDVLRGKIVIIEGVQFIGLDCPPSGIGTTPIPELKTLGINKENASVLLYHIPMGIEDAKKEHINLFLAGHTHAGQLFPFMVIVRLFFKWIYGLYNIKGMHLYISSGLGTWGPPFKFFSPAEIVIHKLVPK